MILKKPVVLFQLREGYYAEVGKPAFCNPINHPSDGVSNRATVRTSPVIDKKGDRFETLNTIYKGV